MLVARWVQAGRRTGSAAARTLRLRDLHGPDLLAAAAADVIARGLSAPAALDAVFEQRRKGRALPIPSR